MQNKLVNTDESINIDELEKSKTISLTSNRSPVLKVISKLVLKNSPLAASPFDGRRSCNLLSIASWA